MSSRPPSAQGGKASPGLNTTTATDTSTAAHITIGGKSLPKSVIESSVSRLSRGTGRVEYLDTPGPYNYMDGREQGRIPYVFRTSSRWPRQDPPMKDRIDADRSAIEPKSIYAVLSSQERWPKDRVVVTKDTSDYDVEKGYLATEPKTFCATFGGKVIDRTIKEEKPLSPIDAEKHLTIANTFINGGVMSHGNRDTIKSFILHSEGPGPIYNPSYAQVEAAGASGVFSSQKRLPQPKHETPSPLAYADSVPQAENLSTRTRSPSCIIGSVPKVFPLPFNIYNICNSRSMRTQLCKNSRDVIQDDGASSSLAKKRKNREMQAQHLMNTTHNSGNTINGSLGHSIGKSHHGATQQQQQYLGGMGVFEDDKGDDNHNNGKTKRNSYRPASNRPSSSMSERPSSALKDWINRQQAVRAKDKDPRRYIAADSPFSTKHYVPPSRRTMVLCEEEDLELNPKILAKMGSYHVNASSPLDQSGLVEEEGRGIIGGVSSPVDEERQRGGGEEIPGGPNQDGEEADSPNYAPSPSENSPSKVVNVTLMGASNNLRSVGGKRATLGTTTRQGGGGGRATNRPASALSGKGSSAVERFRHNVATAQAKRYGNEEGSVQGGEEDVSGIETLSPPPRSSPSESSTRPLSAQSGGRRSASPKSRSGSPHRSSEVPLQQQQAPASTHPRAVQFTKKMPRLTVDEGYHSAQFQRAIQDRVDQATLPESKRNTIPDGEYRWSASKRAKSSAAGVRR